MSNPDRTDSPVADATQRFTDRAADYTLSRPHYPQQLIDLLRHECSLTEHTVVADIGSGTGISAEPFLRYGCTVLGVEPNDAMRTVAEARLAGWPRFRSVPGTAEHTGIDSHSVGLVVAAQAFHWFDVARARTEFSRILDSGGRVVLLWNTRRVEGTAFLREYEQLLQEFGTDYAAVRHRTHAFTGSADAVPAALGDFFGGAFSRHVLDNGQDLDEAGLLSRIRSVSYMPSPGHGQYAAMEAAVSALFRRNSAAGTVRLEYDLEVYTGRVD